MNATDAPRRARLRFLSLAAIASLALAGIAVPTSASAASRTIDVDVDIRGHAVDIYDGATQVIEGGAQTITVELPETIAADYFDSFYLFIDDVAGTFTLSGTTASITLPSGFWNTRPVGSTFELELNAVNDFMTLSEGGDFLYASFSLEVGAAEASTTIVSDTSTIDTYWTYLPWETPIAVTTGDTIVIDVEPGFWTTGPAGTADFSEVFTNQDSVEVSGDGSTATVTIGEPSRYDEATAPSGIPRVDVIALQEDPTTEVISMSMPLEFAKPTPTVDRVDGADRYEVAAAISESAYPEGSDVAYIAAGTVFADALSAAPAAALEGGPLLLTLPDRIPASIADEIARLDLDRIVVVGGNASVSTAVFEELDELVPTVDRIGGADRFEVSRGVAEYAFGTDGSEVAFVATGATFPDALSASSAAGAFGAPVILVRGTANDLDGATASTLEALGVTFPIIAGGPVSVSTGIESDLDAFSQWGPTLRLSGRDRYEASLAIARFAFDSTDRIFIASGEKFPDALAGAAWAGTVGAPLYIAPSSCVPDGMVADIGRYAESQITLLGGTNSLSPAVASLKKCGFGDLPEDGWGEGRDGIDGTDSTDDAQDAIDAARDAIDALDE